MAKHYVNRNLLFAALAVLACLCRPAAAGISYGPANGTVTCNADGVCVSYTKLPVGPAPGTGGGSPSNPADWGMCGLFHVSGTFDNSTAALIIVKDDYYVLERKSGSGKAGIPHATWTCVTFGDFLLTHHGWSPSMFRTFKAPTMTSTAGLLAQDTVGLNDVCVWAGVAGSLAAEGQESVYANAEVVGGTIGGTNQQSALSSSGPISGTVQTYSFCSGLTSFYAWQYDLEQAPLPTGGVQPLVISGYAPTARSFWWCYMAGVGSSPGGTFTGAGLDNVSSTEYYFDVGNQSSALFTCVSLESGG